MSDPTATCTVPTTGVAPATFTAALQLLLAATCSVKESGPVQAKVADKDSFDYIIVGGGSAGCVMANRLSENSKVSVMLIEAGGPAPQESIIPGLAGALFAPNNFTWQYVTESDTNIRQGYQSNPVFWPRGKMLSGSSGMNQMIYYRGVNSDYQAWHDLGNKEWGPNVVKKYFKKMENLRNGLLLENPEIKNNFGTNGPLNIDIFNSTKRLTTLKVLSAFNEIGIRNVEELNSVGQMGSSLFTATVFNGERQSSGRAYLDPVANRKNLKVLSNSLVTKVLIDPKTKKAYGVEVDSDGKKITLNAKKEVILCGGVINTPQVLMLSGIGDEKTLQKLKIEPIVNLPGVGQNLQDHLLVPLSIFGDEPDKLTDLEQAASTVRYLGDRTGSLADLFFADVTSFYSKDKNANSPDFQTLMGIFRKNTSDAFALISGYAPSVLQPLQESIAKSAMYIMNVVLLKPKSRGYITLKSSDPKDAPLIYPNYFKDKKDLTDTAAGLKMLSKIVNTKYFKSINGTIARYNLKACNELEMDSIDYWKCIALNFVGTAYHPVGTAKMGPKSDKNAVVDDHLRVHGVQGLRVVDASIMPTIPSANTNGPTMMIAERAADIIKNDSGSGDWGGNSKATKGKGAKQQTGEKKGDTKTKPK